MLVLVSWCCLHCFDGMHQHEVMIAIPCHTAGNSGHHAGGGLRHRSAMPRNMPRRRAMRKGVLVAPRDNWPYLDSGLSMELCGTAC